jgi:hypothetical protein
MTDITATGNWMLSRQGAVGYSMDYTLRKGPNYYDCSSAVLNALKAGGFVDFDYPGNTETLYGLDGTVLEPITRSQVRDWDLFVSGKKGGSGGSAGHTGFLIWQNGVLKAVHCTYSKGQQNIVITNADGWMGDFSGLPVHYYRVKRSGSTSIPGANQKPQMVVLAVDGFWGPGTTQRLQEYYSLPIRDGVISHQYKQKYNANIVSAQFDLTLTGSNLIKEMQRRLVSKGFYAGKIDGLCGDSTVRAMQKAFGTTQDGVISTTSNLVKAMQKALNSNKMPF